MMCHFRLARQIALFFGQRAWRARLLVLEPPLTPWCLLRRISVSGGSSLLRVENRAGDDQNATWPRADHPQDAPRPRFRHAGSAPKPECGETRPENVDFSRDWIRRPIVGRRGYDAPATSGIDPDRRTGSRNPVQLRRNCAARSHQDSADVGNSGGVSSAREA